ncbi:histidine kinase [Clostridium septicum]|uniref:Histidine kinase n=2 Tax=Clostridium septicum TaxID=1504 RepID=A0A9N7JLI9_CLOSE|nr:GHKL domain-containing protein [Clostridium septicum]AYE34086.1 histidine kinase [Clostridium septicum]
MIQKKLKIKYFSLILICMLIIIFLSFRYITTIKSIYKNNLKELASTSIEFKKNSLKEIVNKTVQEIDIERDYIIKDSIKILDSISIDENLLNFDNITLVTSKILKVNPEMNIFIWDNISNKLIYTSDSKLNTDTILTENDFLTYINTYKLNRYKLINDSKIIAFCISDKSIEEKVQEIIKDRIRKIDLNNNSYIWINKILNYEGGDNYAIRLVHPNLIETEGEMLSTNTPDIKNNLPYLTELEGIKANGEVFHDYYFKKKNCTCISHKLSYGKLYPKYNWIICSGDYLDDLEDLINKETVKFKKDMILQISITILVGILCFITSGIIGFLLLNLINIHEFALMKQKNDITNQHYNILERKYDKTNEIIHDMKNHMSSIKALAELDNISKVVEYIESINNDIGKLSNIVITNNKIIDIILNEKIYLIKKHNINFKYEVQPFNLDFIQNKDICTIIGNLLDNSIESCINSKNKDIFLKIHCFNENFIVMKVTNSCDKKPIIINNKLATIKEGIDHHGYGIKNIEKSLKKYFGTMIWDYDAINNTFMVTLTIPVPSKQKDFSIF